MASYKIMSFEQFAAQNGASRQDIGDCSLHRSSEHVSRRAHLAAVERQAGRDRELTERRAALRVEFDQLVAEGHVREPNLRERMSAAAAWPGPRGDAARRILVRLNAIPSSFDPSPEETHR